jgi:hypothetical protein
MLQGFLFRNSYINIKISRGGVVKGKQDIQKGKLHTSSPRSPAFPSK